MTRVTQTKPAKQTKMRPRTCVACREESPKRALIRVVRSPAGEVFLDESGKLPGRGAYICARMECLEKAKKSRALARALKAEVKQVVYERLAEYISSSPAEAADVQKELCLLLGLARRAGLLYIGVDGVKSHSGDAPLLILTAGGCSEPVYGAAQGLAEGGRHVHLPEILDVSALSSAIGAEGVQAVALPGRSGLADKIKLLVSVQQTQKTTEKFSSLSSGEGSTALEQNESV